MKYPGNTVGTSWKYCRNTLAILKEYPGNNVGTANIYQNAYHNVLKYMFMIMKFEVKVKLIKFAMKQIPMKWYSFEVNKSKNMTITVKTYLCR